MITYCLVIMAVGLAIILGRGALRDYGGNVRASLPLTPWQKATAQMLERTYVHGVYMDIPLQEWDRPSLYASGWFAQLAATLHFKEPIEFQYFTRQYLLRRLNQITPGSIDHGLPALYQIQLVVKGLKSLHGGINTKTRRLIQKKIGVLV
uniref:hypothetical protein n=1 Tax=Sulfobacillus thermotolerans TaxID=338644 RepID=UPI00155DB639|nr:hypothetical protein [Sulfobacillus thermotolerans]